MARYTTKWRRRDDLRLARMFGYLKRTADYALHSFVTAGDELRIEAYVDADFAGDRDSRRSTTAYCVFLCGPGTRSLISWHSSLQKSISLSTCEAEYKALVECGREVLGTAPVVEFLDGQEDRGGDGITARTLIHDDSQACLGVAQSGRSKNLRYLRKTAGIYFGWAKDHLSRFLRYVRSKRNTADIGTKIIEVEDFDIHRRQLGVLPLSTFKDSTKASERFFAELGDHHASDDDIVPDWGASDEESNNDNRVEEVEVTPLPSPVGVTPVRPEGSSFSRSTAATLGEQDTFAKVELKPSAKVELKPGPLAYQCGERDAWASDSDDVDFPSRAQQNEGWRKDDGECEVNPDWDSAVAPADVEPEDIGPREPGPLAYQRGERKRLPNFDYKAHVKEKRARDSDSTFTPQDGGETEFISATLTITTLKSKSAGDKAA